VSPEDFKWGLQEVRGRALCGLSSWGADAQDFLQEACEKAFEKGPAYFSTSEHLLRWLVTVAWNHAATKYRADHPSSLDGFPREVTFSALKASNGNEHVTSDEDVLSLERLHPLIDTDRDDPAVVLERQEEEVDPIELFTRRNELFIRAASSIATLLGKERKDLELYMFDCMLQHFAARRNSAVHHWLGDRRCISTDESMGRGSNIGVCTLDVAARESRGQVSNALAAS
jgi:DNA-directed RNA polymerase specialized sigma24 family protein